MFTMSRHVPMILLAVLLGAGCDASLEPNEEPVGPDGGVADDLEEDDFETYATGSEANWGLVWFDAFAGSTDDDKMRAMNTWSRQQAGPTRTVMFDARTYSFTVPIDLNSGLSLMGAKRATAREFSRATIFKWQGPSGSSMLRFPGSQVNQSYPSDGSPRDISISFIQFQGNTSVHWLPKYDQGTWSQNGPGHVLWYCQFEGLSFIGFATIWWGWADGCSFTGSNHFQAVGDTAFYVGGSENLFFGRDAQSFADSAATTGKPFFRSALSKSTIGQIMITARTTGTGLSIEGGHNLVVDGLMIDAQDSAPIYGPGLRISGGDGITIANSSFKGMATSPSSSSNANAWIQVTGGTQITFTGNNFRRAGTNMPATSYPVLYASSNVPAGAVKWGYNGYSNWGGQPAVVQQASAGKITVTPDPTLQLK